MRRAVALLLLLVLGAPTAVAEDESESAAKTESGAVAVVAAIYKTYTDNQHGDPGPAGIAGVYSKRLQALIDKDEAETPAGDVGRMDWDPFVDGQDWEVTGLNISQIYQSGGEARVRASSPISASRGTSSSTLCAKTGNGASTTSPRR